MARPHAKKKARGRAETAVARPHRAKEKGTAELNIEMIILTTLRYTYVLE